MAKGKLNHVTSEVQRALPEILGESIASAGYSRLGRSTGNNTLDDKIRLNNIANYSDVFSVNSSGYISNTDPIVLCRNAYRHFAPFTTAINILTDISNTPISLKGGNAQSSKFFDAWLKRINSPNLSEQFFRESYLSGNIFFHRYDIELTSADVAKLGQVYAADGPTKTIEIPGRYTLLDPATICAALDQSGSTIYHRVLSKLELDRLGASAVKEDKELYKSIRKSIDKYVTSENAAPVAPIDQSKLHIAFYNKQDYEPFATPMGYCVLDDINLKLELRKMDAILARSVELSLLVVTAGAEEAKGGVSRVVMDALKKQFASEKVGRVLVSDHTTKVEFVHPKIAEMLTPQKYEDINASISSGLMNIFFGEQKFADSVNKLRAITKKVENVQRLFLAEFLNPEIKRVSKIMGFKSYPTAVMQPVRIDDQTNFMRVYAQLMQMGILSPKDGLQLMETGVWPEYETVEINQKALKEARDSGLFQPVQGGAYDNREALKLGGQIKNQQAKQAQQAGRPSGTKSPQTTKKVSQIGASEVNFSRTKLIDNTKAFYALKESFASAYKDKFKIKRFTPAIKEEMASKMLILCKLENPEAWASKIEQYLQPSADKLLITEVDAEIIGISQEYEASLEDATILYHSKV